MLSLVGNFRQAEKRVGMVRLLLESTIEGEFRTLGVVCRQLFDAFRIVLVCRRGGLVRREGQAWGRAKCLRSGIRQTGKKATRRAGESAAE